MTFGEVLWLVLGAFAGVAAAFGALGLVEVLRGFGHRRARAKRGDSADLHRDL